MTGDHAHHPRLERRLARLLQGGTWLGSLVILAGLGLLWTGDVSSHLRHGAITLGIAIFIALPIMRVALMLAVFLHDRDYRFAAIALAVLVIIALAAMLGMYAGGQSG